MESSSQDEITTRLELANANLRALVVEALGALEPFARYAHAYHSFDGQHDFLNSDEIKLGAFKCTVGDIRKARAVFAKLKGYGP